MASNTAIAYALDHRQYLHRAAWRRLRKRYPELKRHPHLLRLLVYLINGPRDPKSGYLPLSAVLVSRIYHGDKTIGRDRNISVRRDIETLERITGSKISLTKYDKKNNVAREVYEFVASPEVARLIFTPETPSLWHKGIVNLITGEIITPAERRAWWEARRAQADEHNAKCAHEDGRIWLQYMNHDITLEMLKPDRVNIQTAAAYCERIESDTERAYAYSTLYSIVTLPHMPYEWSPRSLRLFGKSVNAQNIKNELRKRLWPDLYELDLTSCQLAIFARVCHVPEVQTFLDTGRSIWPYLARQCELPLTDNIKAALKILLYEIIFGAATHTLFWRMPNRSLTSELLAPFTPAERMLFLAIPEINALITARDRMLREIRNAKGMVNAYDEWIPIVNTGPSESHVNARSVLAQVVQSWEFRLLAPFRQMTMEEGRGSHGWRCLIWSHDGASIRIKHPQRDAQATIDRLTNAVNAYAARFGIISQLEIKNLRS